eukprot:295750-Chlamydomonas_euryale.AAC.1
MLVPDEYVRYLVRLANVKFDDNEARIGRFEDAVAEMLDEAQGGSGRGTHPPASARAHEHAHADPRLEPHVNSHADARACVASEPA